MVDPAKRRALRSGEKVRLLLVEDCPDHADLIRAKLGRSKRLKVEITHVDRLEKGLAKLKAGVFDIVLLDFSLPDSYGLDTFRRANEAAPRTPIIVLTSLDDNDLAVQAVREGAQDYLIKREADTRLLVRSILYAMERQAAEEALRRLRGTLRAGGARRQRRALGLGPRGRSGVLLAALEVDARFLGQRRRRQPPRVVGPHPPR